MLVEDALSNLDDRRRREMSSIGVVPMTTDEVARAMDPSADYRV